MNNEFNNQNMNQFQNNNMNSQYLNNYNNLNNQNNKSGNGGLIAILVIIIIALAGVCLYLFVDNKDSDVDNNKDNNIQENESNEDVDNDENTDLISRFPLNNKEDLNEIVTNLPITVIANGHYDYKYIFESHAIYTVLDKLSHENNLSKNEWDITRFNYDELYVYNGGRDESQVEYYKGKDVIEKIKEIFNYNIKLESKSYGGCQVHTVSNNCIVMEYDEKIDKLVVAQSGGTAGKVINTIINSSYANNIYKINYVNHEYSPAGNGCYEIVDNNDKINTLCSDKELNDYSLAHKDELPQYEVSFKINDDNTYEFLNLKKVN